MMRETPEEVLERAKEKASSLMMRGIHFSFAPVRDCNGDRAYKFNYMMRGREVETIIEKMNEQMITRELMLKMLRKEKDE